MTGLVPFWEEQEIINLSLSQSLKEGIHPRIGRGTPPKTQPGWHPNLRLPASRMGGINVCCLTAQSAVFVTAAPTH